MGGGGVAHRPSYLQHYWNGDYVARWLRYWTRDPEWLPQYPASEPNTLIPATEAKKQQQQNRGSSS